MSESRLKCKYKHAISACLSLAYYIFGPSMTSLITSHSKRFLTAYNPWIRHTYLTNIRMLTHDKLIIAIYVDTTH